MHNKKNKAGNFARKNNEGLSNSKAASRGVLYKKGVFKNFTKFTEKHLCQGLFFSKVADSGTGVFL